MELLYPGDKVDFDTLSGELEEIIVGTKYSEIK